MKLTPSRYLILLVAAFLPACQGQSVTQTVATSVPTAILPTATLTLESALGTSVPTPTPTRPGSVPITPDRVQVERWLDYQTALAKTILYYLPLEDVLCEWEILGSSGNDVYVWAVCRGKDSGASLPAVIHLESDGSVVSVETAESNQSKNLTWSENIARLFPPEVREKFAYYNSGRAREMQEHIEWRRTHPGIPPQIILSATPTP